MSGATEGFDARAVYGAGSAAYEDASSQFWAYLSTRTVERLALAPGQRVLDVACGTGPALLAAAERVGESGRVVGLDYAEEMVAIARAKLAERGFHNVEVRVADMGALDDLEGGFDAVICVLGIFFVPDMRRQVQLLAGQARRGGRVALTVFGELFFEPMRHHFVEVVGEVAPQAEVVEPWRRTRTEVALRSVIEAAGFGEVSVFTDDDVLPLVEPSDWWRIVMGSGLRHTVLAIGPEAAAEVRVRCERRITDLGITQVTTRSRYAIATT